MREEGRAMGNQSEKEKGRGKEKGKEVVVEALGREIFQAMKSAM